MTSTAPARICCSLLHTTSNKPIWHTCLCTLCSVRFWRTTTTTSDSCIPIERSLCLVSVYSHMLGYRQRVEQVRTNEICLFCVIFAVKFIWHTSYVRIRIIIYLCSNTIARWRTSVFREKKVTQSRSRASATTLATPTPSARKIIRVSRTLRIV
jgi:hypothetical protein